MASSFLGKRALITGGSRGIGRAIALRLAQDGADVAITGRRAGRNLIQTQAGIQALGRECLIFHGDLGESETVDGLFDHLNEAWPDLHILVNNAALGSFAPAEKLTLRQWHFTLERCVTQALLCTQKGAKMMTSGWGRVINLSSLGAQRYLPHYGAVGASKAALESLTRTFAVELAPRGIVVNGISPGMVKTSSLQHLPAPLRAQFDDYQARCPQGRVAEVEDIADLAALLCSDDARWLVGQTLIADGGFSLR